MIAASSGGATTARAVVFVAQHRQPAEALGVTLAELINDPDAFAADLRRGLTSLVDPDYLAGQRRIAPGIGALHGIRWPLLAAVQHGFRITTKGIRPTPLHGDRAGDGRRGREPCLGDPRCPRQARPRGSRWVPQSARGNPQASRRPSHLAGGDVKRPV
jgi:hypothetical protein